MSNKIFKIVFIIISVLLATIQYFSCSLVTRALIGILIVLLAVTLLIVTEKTEVLNNTLKNLVDDEFDDE